MSNIWLISDLHIDHANVIEYCNRPFSSVEEMNKVLIENWNKAVKQDDVVYFLGDLLMGKHTTERDLSVVCRLRGEKTIIIGNHDFRFTVHDDNKRIRNKTQAVDYWESIGFHHASATPMILENFMLSHEPLKQIATGYINIHGHTHNNNLKSINHINVSVENIDYKPINFEELRDAQNDKIVYGWGL